MSVRKIYSTAALALADVLRDDMTIMSGGFGLCGIPSVLIDAVLASGVRGLTIISNNPGAEGLGLGKLFNTRQVHKLICSYAGENAQFARQYMAGEALPRPEWSWRDERRRQPAARTAARQR